MIRGGDNNKILHRFLRPFTATSSQTRIISRLLLSCTAWQCPLHQRAANSSLLSSLLFQTSVMQYFFSVVLCFLPLFRFALSRLNSQTNDTH